MIAMIGAEAVQTPRGQPMAAGADRFPRSGRKPSRGAFIRPTGANAAHRVGNDLREAGTDKFPCLGRKPSTGCVDGEWRPARTSFRVRDESRPEGRSFGPQGRMPLIGRRAVGVKAIRRKHPSDPQFPHSAGCRRFAERWNSPLVETACITCNTYSVPYKGKTLKKRLSPKSVNTLIHQCITFHVFLIFQYLSLWKSVFSSN